MEGMIRDQQLSIIYWTELAPLATELGRLATLQNLSIKQAFRPRVSDHREGQLVALKGLTIVYGTALTASPAKLWQLAEHRMMPVWLKLPGRT